MSKFNKSIKEIATFSSWIISKYNYSPLEDEMSKVVKNYFKSDLPRFQSKEERQKAKDLFGEECGEELNAIWDKYIALHPDYQVVKKMIKVLDPKFKAARGVKLVKGDLCQLAIENHKVVLKKWFTGQTLFGSVLKVNPWGQIIDVDNFGDEIMETHNYDWQSYYPINANLFWVNEALSTKSISSRQPCYGMVIDPPSIDNSFKMKFLKFIET